MILVILFFLDLGSYPHCYFERRETLGARETPRRSRPFARSMSFGPSASPRRSPKGAVLAAVAAGDAMLDAESADLRWSLKRSHSTPPAPRRAGSATASPSRGNIGGWLRSHLGGVDDGFDDGGAGAPGTAGVRFELPPSPASAPGAGASSDASSDDALFRQGVFNAVCNGLLLLLVGLLYAVSALLAQWRGPLLWALLTSLALRDVKTSLVRFFEETLERRTLLGLALAPIDAAAGLLLALLRRAEVVLGLRPREREREGKPAARKTAAAPRATAPASASTFHFRWLFFAGAALELRAFASRDWALATSIAALAAVAACAAVSTLAVVATANWYLFAREGAYAEKAHPVASDDPSDDASAFARRKRRLDRTPTGTTTTGERRRSPGGFHRASSPGSNHPAFRASKAKGAFPRWVPRWVVALDASTRRALAASLHSLVAVGLIVALVAVACLVAAFFAVNIARESSAAAAAARSAYVAATSGASSSLKSRSLSDESTRHLLSAAAFDSPAFRETLEAAREAWENAVETKWPAALAWAQERAEAAFPGADVNAVWNAARDVYREVTNAEENVPGTDRSLKSGGRRGGRLSSGASGSSSAAPSPAWATAVKEAGRMVRDGDVYGAFKQLSDALATLAREADGSGPGGGARGNALGRVAEALRGRASALASMAARSSSAVASMATRVSFALFGVAGGIVAFALRCVVFLTVLFHILSMRTDPAVRLAELLPTSDRDKSAVVAAVARGVRGVFASCAKLALFHAAFTFITFRAFDVHFVYTSTLASGATAILPLLASWSVSLPAALGLVAEGRPWSGAALVATHWVTLVFVDIDIYQSEIRSVHPYIVGLSVVGGMCVFEPALQGAVLGPLLVVALATGHQLYRELLAKKQRTEDGRGNRANEKSGGGGGVGGERWGPDRIEPWASAASRKRAASLVSEGGSATPRSPHSRSPFSTSRGGRDAGGWDASVRT